MMTYQYFIPYLLDFLFALASLVSGADKPDDSQQAHVTYELLIEDIVSARADTISCTLRVQNKSDVLQFVVRPGDEAISLRILGVDEHRYSVTFEGREFRSLIRPEVYLRPKCAIEMRLAKIILRPPKEGTPALAPGGYTVTASWKRDTLPKIAAGRFKVVDAPVPAPAAPPSKDEYPLRITLEPWSPVYRQSEPVEFTVRLRNDGPRPVQMMNFFDRWKDFFRFEKEYAGPGAPSTEDHIAAAITPHAIEGWIILFPGESLSVLIDASEEFIAPGTYQVTTTYWRSSILIHPPSGKPYYTEQHRWRSNKVKIVVLETNKSEAVER